MKNKTPTLAKRHRNILLYILALPFISDHNWHARHWTINTYTDAKIIKKWVHNYTGAYKKHGDTQTQSGPLAIFKTKHIILDFSSTFSKVSRKAAKISEAHNYTTVETGSMHTPVGI